MSAVRQLDVLVDSPFIMDERNTKLRFRGSNNQRLIDVQATLAQGEIVKWND
jgi:anaerobic ribonucleoside-triphosphate reductase activating protein